MAAAAVTTAVVVHVVRGPKYHDTRGATIVRFTQHSRLLGRNLHDVLILPAGGGRGRPLLAFLHGRGASSGSYVDQHLFDGLRALGPRAPVVFFPDGGDHSYWHDRSDGRWGTAVLGEAIPGALARSHADRKRLAIGGISMGGFGALDLARLAPLRFCAVGAHSAALWTDGGQTPSGAFDDAADFARHDLIRFAREHTLVGVPVWMDVGRDDPFEHADTILADELRAHGVHVTFQLHGGGHSGWSGRMPEYLRWYANALARC